MIVIIFVDRSDGRKKGTRDLSKRMKITSIDHNRQPPKDKKAQVESEGRCLFERVQRNNSHDGMNSKLLLYEHRPADGKVRSSETLYLSNADIPVLQLKSRIPCDTCRVELDPS